MYANMTAYFNYKGENENWCDKNSKHSWESSESCCVPGSYVVKQSIAYTVLYIKCRNLDTVVLSDPMTVRSNCDLTSSIKHKACHHERFKADVVIRPRVHFNWLLLPITGYQWLFLLWNIIQQSPKCSINFKMKRC